MKPKVLVVGSSNTDMVVKVPHIPAPGETVMGEDLMTIQGGKGANQAVAAARAGADVTFIACIADDAPGTQSVQNYNKEAIDTSFVKVQPGTHSGIALINVADDGENSISVAPGANSYLLPEDIRSSGKAFLNAKIVLAQLEIPMKTVEVVAEMAKENGVPFILNPAPGNVIPDSLFEMVTVITPNETEAAILTSRNKFLENELPVIAEEIFSKGVKVVIITLGKKGVYVKSDEFEGIIGGYKVHAVDTTAAGDVFNGALASAMATEMTLTEAIDFAQKAAAISVTRIGAQPSAPVFDEIKDFS